MSHDHFFLIAMAGLFLNGALASRAWHKGRPGWAGIYAASFTCCVLALGGLRA